MDFIGSIYGRILGGLNIVLFENSETRFGQNSILWQNLRSFGQFLTTYLVYGKMLNQLGQFLLFRAIFHCSKSPNIGQIMNSFGHPVGSTQKVLLH